MNTYYVYAYVRTDGTPYYIGKGTGDRAWVKGRRESIKKPTDPARIVIVENNLTNTGALAIERRLIRWYGRIDQGTGILRNRTNGGDGGTGAKHGNKLSEETKKKISLSHKGKSNGPMSEESKKKLSDSLKGKNLGKKWTEERKIAQSEKQKGQKRKPHTEATKQRLREINLGKHLAPFTEEHKRKISEALKGVPKNREAVEKQRAKVKGRVPSEEQRKAFLLGMENNKKTCPHCNKTTTSGNYTRWHGDNCRNK